MQTIKANKVVLNLATRPLHRLLQNSMLPNATEVNEQLESPYVNRATKLYLYYPQAWWLQAGLNNGSLQYVDETWPPVNAPIIGRSVLLGLSAACMASCTTCWEATQGIA